MSERFKPNKNAIYDKYNLVQEKHLNNEWLLEHFLINEGFLNLVSLIFVVREIL